VEVQGYVYAAKVGCARLFRLAGEGNRADGLERQAAELKERFNRRYWLDDRGFHALALQRGGRLARAIASNPGQALLTGIVHAEKVEAVARRLLADDTFSGWGIRTLSSAEAAYNPIDYQVGSVWPRDNALIGLGLHRCGRLEAVERVFTGLFEAASHFPNFRLPEVFDGFSRQEHSRPVPYPVACNPQAWAAGAIPLLLQAALGLEPDAPRRTLRIVRPCLPAWLKQVTLRSLRVGQATVDLRYHRDGATTLVAMLRREGDLDVLIEYSEGSGGPDT
jgi:glycogen debranching enzyme